ncbi:methylated-DNA--[protein]-cysteine S-methyltransferase [Leucobacter soli]|uniref:methylated-DNA--[protein]-cysteine S-methyltransferase n=1 Tax=Leucobacter soli TaxID=2812850 RepID=UPI0036116228
MRRASRPPRILPPAASRNGWPGSIPLAVRGVEEAPTGSGPIAEALRSYAAGEFTALDDLPVAQPETPFRGEVWRALRRVPAGEAVTYTELAARAGRPTAVRAAASGCANNLVALIVPCHRIVRTDGGLGGYLFGTDIKRRLLEHECALR